MTIILQYINKVKISGGNTGEDCTNFTPSPPPHQVTSAIIGSHWMFEIVSMLTRGSADYDPLPREAAWIDIQPLERVMDTLPKPRILGTHIPLGWLPTNFRYVTGRLQLYHPYRF